jgi:hypothetical protein
VFLEQARSAALVGRAELGHRADVIIVVAELRLGALGGGPTLLAGSLDAGGDPASAIRHFRTLGIWQRSLTFDQ